MVPTDLQREAAAALPGLLDWMQSGDDDTVRRWLGDLGVLVAGAMGADEARAKLVAYTSLIADDYPRATFTRRTLAAAARRFKFFPSFSELCDFLDETRGDLRTKLDRLQRLATPLRKRQEPEDEPVSLDQRQRAGELFGMLGQALRTGDWSAVNAECDRIKAQSRGDHEA